MHQPIHILWDGLLAHRWVGAFHPSSSDPTPPEPWRAFGPCVLGSSLSGLSLGTVHVCGQQPQGTPKKTSM